VEFYREIPVYGPFNLRNALDIIQRIDQPHRQSNHIDRYIFTHETPGGAVAVMVCQSEPDGFVSVRISGDLANDQVAEEVVLTVSRMFSLTVDPADFFDQTRNDEFLNRLASRHPDLRPILFTTPFEAALRLLIGHNLTGYQSAALIANVREVCGIVPAGKPHSPPAFPGKYTLLSVPDRLLAVAGLPVLKIRMVKLFVSSLAADPDPLEEVFHITNPVRAREKLLQLPGIDRQSADFLLQRAYGFQDILTTHPYLIRAVKRYYHLKRLPDEDTIAIIAEPFIPWRSWWSFLLQIADQVATVV